MSQLYQRRRITTDRTIQLMKSARIRMKDKAYEISKNKNERIKGNVIVTIQMCKSKL